MTNPYSSGLDTPEALRTHTEGHLRILKGCILGVDFFSRILGRYLLFGYLDSQGVAGPELAALVRSTLKAFQCSDLVAVFSQSV